MLITRFSNKLLLWCFQRPFFATDTESTTLSKYSTVQTQQTKKMLTQIKHWKTGIYQRSADCASYYYNRKVLMYNVYLVNNPYSYSELSIFVPLFLLRETHAEVIYSYFRHLSDWSFTYQHFSQFSNMCCLFHFSHNILGKSKDTIKFVLIYRSK